MNKRNLLIYLWLATQLVTRIDGLISNSISSHVSNKSLMIDLAL